MIRSAVSLLLFACCPIAIIGLVALLIVSAFQRQPFGALTHIREKVAECHPAIAHCNASPAVVCEFETVGIRATLNHAVPRLVCSSAMRGVSVSMLKSVAVEIFPRKASAGLCKLGTQPACLSGDSIPAVANALITVVTNLPSYFWRTWFDYDKPCEAGSSGDRFQFRHSISNSMLCLAAGVQHQLALTATQLSYTTLEMKA